MVGPLLSPASLHHRHRHHHMLPQSHLDPPATKRPCLRPSPFHHDDHHYQEEREEGCTTSRSSPCHDPLDIGFTSSDLELLRDCLSLPPIECYEPAPLLPPPLLLSSPTTTQESLLSSSSSFTEGSHWSASAFRPPFHYHNQEGVSLPSPPTSVRSISCTSSSSSSSMGRTTAPASPSSSICSSSSLASSSCSSYILEPLPAFTGVALEPPSSLTCSLENHHEPEDNNHNREYESDDELQGPVPANDGANRHPSHRPYHANERATEPLPPSSPSLSDAFHFSAVQYLMDQRCLPPPTSVLHRIDERPPSKAVPPPQPPLSQSFSYTMRPSALSRHHLAMTCGPSTY